MPDLVLRTWFLYLSVPLLVLKWANDTDTEGLTQNSSVKRPPDLHGCKCYVDCF